MKFITKDSMNIAGLRKLWVILLAVIIVLGAVCLFVKGFNLDTDFAGGISLQYYLDKDVEKSDIESIKSQVLAIEGVDTVTVQKFDENGEKTGFILKTLEISDEKVREIDNVVYGIYGDSIQSDTVAEKEAEEAKDAETEETEEAEETDEAEEKAEQLHASKYAKIGASVSKEIKDSAIKATIIAVILMLLYITVRFKFKFAVAAVLCLIHDIFVVICAYSLLGIPVSSNIIAVLLTILGYSINATIIIFDRVRENQKLNSRLTNAELVNKSVRQTLWRSVNTTITTFLTIGAVYVLGVHSIREFALPLIIGIVAGLYSSLFLSCTFWYMLEGEKKQVK